MFPLSLETQDKSISLSFMNITQGLSLLNRCFQFTCDNSKSYHGNKPCIARVVYFETLKEYIYDHDKLLYEMMCQSYQNLNDFLLGQAKYIARNYGDKEWKLWSYEIMTSSKYNHDLRHKHGYFKPLLNPNTFVDPNLVFVIYRKQDKKAFDLERSKAKQKAILAAQQKLDIQNQSISADEFILQFQKANRDEDLIRRRKNIFDQVKSVTLDLFPQIPVEIYGSTRNGSCNYGTDLNICIRGHDNDLMSNATKYDRNLKNLKETPYDFNYIASQLKKKTDLKHIKTTTNFRQKSYIQFYDSEVRIPCTLSFDDQLGLEASLLISEYVKLDTRVGPFIYAVKMFVLSHGISFENEGFPNSYGYTIMALYFLMNALKDPVIPSLQNFQGACYTYNCSWYSEDINCMTKSMKINVSFHDCVCIQNNATDKYNTDKPKTDTIWYGDNKSHLINLLASFFTYFSIKDNFKNISIIYDDISLIKKDWSKDDCIVIQDPFFIDKNISASCFESSVDYIIYKFNQAATKLREGKSFEQVCSP